MRQLSLFENKFMCKWYDKRKIVVSLLYNWCVVTRDEDFMAKNNKYTVIDLFAGCGGLSLGLYQAGWNGLFAIEKNEFAFATLKANLIDIITKKQNADDITYTDEDFKQIRSNIRKYRKVLDAIHKAVADM